MCYEVFVLMKLGSKMNFTQIFFFCLFPTYFSIVMLWFTYQCTVIDRQNKAISNQCLLFYNHIQQVKSFPVMWKLKAQLFARRNRLECYVMKLFAGYRINSNTVLEVNFN